MLTESECDEASIKVMAVMKRRRGRMLMVMVVMMVVMMMKNVIDDGAGVDIAYQRFNFVTGYSRCVPISQTVKISECVKHQFRG